MLENNSYQQVGYMIVFFNFHLELESIRLDQIEEFLVIWVFSDF